jgi:hypothetical protein
VEIPDERSAGCEAVTVITHLIYDAPEVTVPSRLQNSVVVTPIAICAVIRRIPFQSLPVTAPGTLDSSVLHNIPRTAMHRDPRGMESSR